MRPQTLNLRERKFMARILMVDDEAKIREVVKEYANFEGIEVVEAADGM